MASDPVQPNPSDEPGACPYCTEHDMADDCWHQEFWPLMVALAGAVGDATPEHAIGWEEDADGLVGIVGDAPYEIRVVPDEARMERVEFAVVINGVLCVAFNQHGDTGVLEPIVRDFVARVSAPTPDRDLAGQFCGQMQPHDAHRWTRDQLTLSLWQFCAGVGGVPAEPQPTERTANLALSGWPRDSESFRPHWIAAVDDELPDGSRYRWQPALFPTKGIAHSLDIWFATSTECEQYIRDHIIGAHLKGETR